MRSTREREPGIRFASGTTWTIAGLEQAYIAQRSTGGDGVINGFFGADTINAAAGADVIGGYDGNDLLNGGAGSDEIYGGDGGDIVTGGTGDDWMFGEDGADTFAFAKFDRDDDIRDFDIGEDIIELSGLTGVATFSDVLAHATQVGDDTYLDLGAEGTINLAGVVMACCKRTISVRVGVQRQNAPRIRRGESFRRLHR